MKTRRIALLVCGILVLLGMASVQVGAADSDVSFNFRLIIEPEKPALNLDVWLNKATNETYTVGDSVTVYAQTNRDAYVYIFNVNPKGEVYPILPNKNEKNNFVRAGNTLRVPSGNYKITANDPGTETLIAIATLKPMNSDSFWLQKAMDAGYGGEPVSSTPEDFLTRLKWTELQPFHNGQYASKIISFNVQQQYYSRYGNLSITSVPSGAIAFVDGKQIGMTPCTVRDLTVGSHEVTLVKDKYHTIVENVSVLPNQTRYLTYTLDRLATSVPVSQTVYSERYTLTRENDGFTRRISTDMGYTITLQVRPKESFTGRLYNVESTVSLQPGGDTANVYTLDAGSSSNSDIGKVISKNVGPFTVQTTIENMDLYEQSSVFTITYYRSVTLMTKIIWNGN